MQTLKVLPYTLKSLRYQLTPSPCPDHDTDSSRRLRVGFNISSSKTGSFQAETVAWQCLTLKVNSNHLCHPFLRCDTLRPLEVDYAAPQVGRLQFRGPGFVLTPRRRPSQPAQTSSRCS